MNPSFSRILQRLAAVLLLAVASVALALPAPKDIDKAVNEGHFAQAEAMLREVLKEKPGSAKAHYELGQVLAREKRYEEARQELQQAQKLDASLKFAASPERFHQVLDAVTSATQSGRPQPLTSGSAEPRAMAPAAAAAPQAPSFPWGLVALGAVVLGVIAMLVRRAAAAKPVAANAYNVQEPRGFGAAYDPSPVVPAAAAAPWGGAAPSAGVGSAVKGAVVGGLAGMAAGYALSKALEGDHPQGHSQGAVPAATPAPQDTMDYVPFDKPADPDLGAFDAGSGDSWDAADASGGDDDNW